MPLANELQLANMRDKVEAFADITDAAWDAFSALMSPLSLSAGQYFLRNGEHARYLAFVVKGVLREFYITAQGSEFNKAFVLADGFTGSLYDLLSGQPSTVSIQALKESQLLVASFDEFQRLYDEHACWERTGRLLTQMLFMKKARREYEFLTLSAGERYEGLLQQYPDLEQQVPQYHIASYLGITPVMLSRLRKGKPTG